MTFGFVFGTMMQYFARRRKVWTDHRGEGEGEGEGEGAYQTPELGDLRCRSRPAPQAEIFLPYLTRLIWFPVHWSKLSNAVAIQRM